MGVPEIKAVRTIARSRFFRIEELDLRFGNGVERTYERLPGSGRAAVMVVAINETNEMLLIREYAAGFHEMQLTLVKGAVDRGESLEEAANRELKEEIGFGARRIEFIKKLDLAPGHMGFTINLLLPEPPEVVAWPIADLETLIVSDEFREARAIAGLFLVRHYLTQQELEPQAMGDNEVADDE
jgi:ADP-ribose diphosphatase